MPESEFNRLENVINSEFTRLGDVIKSEMKRLENTVTRVERRTNFLIILFALVFILFHPTFIKLLISLLK